MDIPLRILLFGITQFAVRALKKLIKIGCPPVGMVITPIFSQDITNLTMICEDYQIPVYKVDQVNSPEFLSLVQQTIKPDLILTYTFSQKLSQSLIQQARYAINMHPSLLPYYRGNNPYFWPIANGESKTGVTFHFLSDVLDEGDIIFQEEVPIFPQDTCGLMVSRQEEVSLILLEKVLRQILNNDPLPRIPQPSGSFILAPKPSLRDLFINWAWPNHKILNRIRALNPYSGAYTQYKALVLALYQATTSPYAPLYEPGTIISLSPNGPMVRSGDGAVILNIITAGKKYLLSGSDFIDIEKVKIGEKFTSWEDQ